jgi:O-antigen/teichoic acid export membrane protein
MNNFIKNNYFNHKETIHNFSWRALQIFGKQGLTFFIFILCAKLLTPHDFGIYNYILAVIFMLIIFGDFGISTATSKYVAEYNATDQKKLKLILFNSSVILVSLALIVSLFTVLFGSYFLHEKYIYVLYVLPMLFLAPLSSLYDGIFRGLKRFRELAIISLSVGFVSLLFVYLLVSHYGLTGALISQSLFYFVLVIALFLTYGNLHIQFDKQLMRTIFNYSVVIGFSSIGFFLYSRVDIIILGQYGYVEEIGYYELINQLFKLMYLPFALLGQVLAPNITSYFYKGSISKIITKYISYLKLLLPISILIAILFHFVFPQMINIFLPEYYVEEMLIAIFILSFLIPAKIWGVFQTQGFIVATGFAKIIAVTNLLGGALNVILDIIFINLIGFTGVFWVTLAIHSTNIIIVCSYYIYKLRMEDIK